MLRTVLLACVALLMPHAAAAACDGTRGATGAVTLNVGGTIRAFVVRAASAVDGRTPAPVLVVLHPFGMNAQYMESRVSTRLWPAALMIYPEGLSRAWQTRPGEGDDRDLRFFDALLAWLEEHHCIDQTRVFVLGYSNGAGLASLLACERPQAIAGAAMAAGRLGCEPRTALPVAIGHGLRDATTPYDHAVGASRIWATRNACSSPPRPGTVGCTVAEGCGERTPVLLCTSAGGHEYSSGFTRPALELFQQVR